MRLTATEMEIAVAAIQAVADQHRVLVCDILSRRTESTIHRARVLAMLDVKRDIPAITNSVLGEIFECPRTYVGTCLKEAALLCRASPRIVTMATKPRDVVTFRRRRRSGPMYPLGNIPPHREPICNGTDVTAAFCGDPAPGRSALDQRVGRAEH